MSVGNQLFGDAQTRAEKVRARRARQRREQQRISDKLKPAPAGKRRKRRPRRRYDLTLPVELGAEIRLPALPAIKPGPRLISLLMTILMGLLIRLLLQSPAFYVAEAAVEGNDLLAENQVRSIAQADEMPIFLVNPAKAEARFQEVAEVSQAEVRVGWPNDVSVEIKERVPLVAWKDGYRDWWISEEGVAFLKHGEREGLVHVESETPVLAVQPDPLAQVIDPQVLVAAGVMQAQLPEVEKFLYDPVHGLGFQDPGGWMAYFGTEGDMVMKVRLYQAIIEHLEESGLAPELVSVEDPSSPFYRQ
ncbi:MAG: cell division protein FtsQ/DivIB [Anaerolineales bacterium]